MVIRGEFGVKNRVGALPVMLSPSGIEQAQLPSLSTRERILLDSSVFDVWVGPDSTAELTGTFEITPD